MMRICALSFRGCSTTVVLIVILMVQSEVAADERGAPSDTLLLSLQQALELGLNNNLGFQSVLIDTQIKRHEIAYQRARFGRTVSATVLYEVDRSPSISQLEAVATSENKLTYLSAELSQQLWSGGRVGLELVNARISNNAAFLTIDPIYTSELNLKFTQPLLRGRGDVNRLGLAIAQNRLGRSEIIVEEAARDLVLEISRLYWNLFSDYENFKVKQKSLDGARRVLATVRGRIAQGKEPQNSILQAEFDVARRMEDIVRAEGVIRNSEDDLKGVLGMAQDATGQRMVIIPMEKPKIEKFIADLPKSVDIAISNDGSYRAIEMDIQKTEMDIEVIRDQMRRSVNLTLLTGLQSLGGTYGDNLKSFGKTDGRIWRGEFAVEFPLGDTQDPIRYRQLLLEKSKRELDLKNIRSLIENKVSKVYRRVEIAYHRIKVSEVAVRLAMQNTEEGEKRLKLGLATVQEVLDAQDDQLEVQVKRVNAIVDYNKALVEWEQLIGST